MSGLAYDTYGTMRIKGHLQQQVFFFVANLQEWDMILG